MIHKGNTEKHSLDAFERVSKSLLLHWGLGGWRSAFVFGDH